MKSAEIRKAFLDYFSSKTHAVINSSSLVPENDPSLLFTNAGMVQFKDVFLGKDKRAYSRAVSSQRCVRAGGKHNDLENVGYTARHHTFFEMLGNFSFGDYFKEDAIRFAWEFLTEILKLPEDRLWITVHVTDQEAEDIWLNEIGIDPERITRLDEDNFWQMGDTGPCGPCTEIFWDHGEHVSGGPPGSPDDDLDRYVEIWNLVFMQFERGSDGQMVALPKPSIDTGMGLERISAVMQGVHSNYDIDLFKYLINSAAKIVRCADIGDDSLKVIADHIRSCAFLAMDGVIPSNEGRGYVLRRIIRRALRHGHKLGADSLFFYQLIPALVEVMGDAYPELKNQQNRLSSIIRSEEEQFARTLDNGMQVLNDAIDAMHGKTLQGEVIFRLYDTFGFPTDLTNDIARERSIKLDMEGYEKCMEQQRRRAREASRFVVSAASTKSIDGSTEFIGHNFTEGEARISAILQEDKFVERCEIDKEVIIVLDRTPFYAESGGQIGDGGSIYVNGSEFAVTDCQKNNDHHLHFGRVVIGEFNLGDSVSTSVDSHKRLAVSNNHSATHLLHAALRTVLGQHVTQRGSLVGRDRLRFDFSHNEQVMANTEVETSVMSMTEAKKSGAMALFGEKYGDEVRVVRIGGEFSVELCGGTHVSRTGQIGPVRIFSESSVASGVRRIEAITGLDALVYADQAESILEKASSILKGSRSTILDKLNALLVENKRLQKDVDTLKVKVAKSSGADLLSNVEDVNGVAVLAKIVQGADAKSLRVLADQVRSELVRGVFVLASINGDRASLVAGVTKDLTDSIKAEELMRFFAGQVNGKGGGRADMAQGSASNIEALPKAIASVPIWISAKVG
jgi:alanyl-tRNA synthetase